MIQLLSQLPEPQSYNQQKKGWPWTLESQTNHLEASFLPKVSIITPSYNQGQYLEETIRSILLQNYPNLEFIIIDGGSKDESVEVIRKYEKWITHWVSERDKGTYEAMNKGLAQMTGQYWCIVNSDDILMPNAIAQAVDYFRQNPDCQWLTATTHSIDEFSRVKYTFFPEMPQTKVAGLSFLDRCWIRHPATFLSRKTFDTIGFFAPIDILDYDYWIKLELHGLLPAIIQEPLAGLRYHSSCKSIDFEKALLQNIALQKSILNQFFGNNAPAQKQILDKIHQIQVEYYQVIIKRNIFQGNISEARKYWIELFKYQPTLVFKRWFWGLFTRFFTRKVEEKEFNPFLFLRS
ncbi:Glycosyltransferase involved in cell wall bisynthesis [Flexibacter flexilis DSM 6793]|uniref:Glycosyltransferase involved in cell wall bisynthesis n=1 Tax=Flexibacter flexilis DSM 6793 TaxID=927664 RepID=A0A1I1FZ47_9BACT|nr:glycosyltransferase family 2 protein [Flexibacter flexilis]SFC04316.1 Glycosyltransferase involved in cell wall bisynthesis [Flexibacter flexilis DSM 6793]